jgi:hypothetical protein
LLMVKAIAQLLNARDTQVDNPPRRVQMQPAPRG